MENDIKAQTLHILKNVGIDEKKAKRRINRLSGGEQQRVAIARAMSTNVDVIIADEPTGNLDAKTSATIIDIFYNLAHEQNKCVIMVTHSEKIARQSDVILKLNTNTQNFEPA